MKVLYIEDDIIDQKAFKKIADSLSINYTILSSKKEVDEHFLKPQFYDLVICDFYLSDCTLNDLIYYFNSYRLVVLCAKEQLKTTIDLSNITFVEKPINEKIFIKSEKTITLNLTYFNDLAGDDKEFRIEMFEVALKALPESLQKLQDAIQEKDFEKIKFEVHKMKSGIRVFGVNIVSEISYAEMIALEKNEEILFPILEKIIKNTFIAIDLIKNEQQKLEHI